MPTPMAHRARSPAAKARCRVDAIPAGPRSTHIVLSAPCETNLLRQPAEVLGEPRDYSGNTGETEDRALPRPEGFEGWEPSQGGAALQVRAGWPLATRASRAAARQEWRPGVRIATAACTRR